MNSLGPLDQTITAIEPQERRRGRVNVYVNGKFVVGVFEDVAAALNLRVGQSITTARLQEITEAETLRRAREHAYRLLAFRARSEGEIAERLRRRGYEDRVIETVQESLRQSGFLNDADFAARWVESRGKNRGRRALTAELRQKGVDSETVAETLSENRSETDEQNAALATAIKKVGENPKDRSREAQAKLAAFLQRRGFGWDMIRPVLRQLYAESGADDSPE